MAASLEVVLRLVDQFSGQLTAAGDRMRATGQRMQQVGRTAVLAGAAISAPGIAAIKLAIDFEKSFDQIVALTDTTRAEADKLKAAVLKMAKAFPQSPKELGEAVYFILSSGITDTATAMSVLEASAKAAAAGLGDTKTVADVTTSVMNAYNLKVKDASKVTDTLVNIIKLGKGEPAELAGALGRIVPVASQMGISFNEVGANLAVVSNVGIGAEEGVTALRAVMTSLLKPSGEATELLSSLGLSFEELREQVRERGLLATLQKLMELTGGNVDQIATLFPNTRALVDVLGSVGAQGEDYVDILAKMEGGTGATNRAFQEASQSVDFKFRRSISNLQIAAIKFGTQALPIVTKGIELFGKLVGVFTNLPGPVQKVIIIGSLLVGGLLILVGTLALVVGSLFVVGAAFTATWVLATAGLILVIPALIAIGVVIFKFRDRIIGALSFALNWLRANWPLVLLILLAPFVLAILLLIRKREEVIGIVRSIPGRLGGLAGLFLGAGKALAGAVLDGLKTIAGGGLGIGTAFANAIIGAVNNAIRKINAVIPNKINLPGPLPDIDLPDNPIPMIPLIAAQRGFAGVVQRPTLFLAGERGAERVRIGQGDFPTARDIADALSVALRGQAPFGNITVNVSSDGDRQVSAALELTLRRLAFSLI